MGEIVTSRLELLEGRFAVCRLAPNAEIPAGLVNEPFCSVTRTDDELSIVCPEPGPPAAEVELGWRCFKVEGPLPFDQTGVLAGMAQPLAAAEIGIFVVSTFDTDYLLVKEQQLGAAIETLADAGHQLDLRTG